MGNCDSHSFIFSHLGLGPLLSTRSRTYDILKKYTDCQERKLIPNQLSARHSNILVLFRQTHITEGNFPGIVRKIICRLTWSTSCWFSYLGIIVMPGNIPPDPLMYFWFLPPWSYPYLQPLRLWKTHLGLHLALLCLLLILHNFVSM